MPNFVSRFAQRLKAILGTTNWWDAVPISLTATKAHVDSGTNPHATTAAQVGAPQSVDGVRNDGGDIDLVGGANVTITPNDSTNSIVIAASGSTGYGTVQDEGSAVTQRATLNFVGPAVSASDNAGATRTDINISGVATVQDEGSPVTQRGTLNFVGETVTVTDNSGAGRTDVTIPPGILYFSTTTVSLATGTTLTSGAFRKLHILSGASHTTVLPAGATDAIVGFEVPLSSTGLYTLDGSGAETIDGAATRVMWAGEAAWLRWNGTEWRKVAGKSRAMSASLRSTAVQSVPTGAVTKLTFNTVDVDVGGMADDPNDQITARRAGNYFLEGYAQLVSGVAATRVAVAVRRNTAGLAAGETSVPSGNVDQYPAATGTRLLPLAAGDSIDLAVYHTSAAARNTASASGESASPHLSVREIDPW